MMQFLGHWAYKEFKETKTRMCWELREAMKKDQVTEVSFSP